MTPKSKTLTLTITPDQQGQYLTLPFTLPDGTAELRLSYSYPKMGGEPQTLPNGQFTPQEQANIVDLGLLTPDGRQAGVSGSNKHEIVISGASATPGYHPQAMTPGEWQILVGAYKIAPEGVTVTYELTFVPKARRLLLGDIHTHTVGSDGLFTVEELATQAQRHGLDFLAITDHNQMARGAVLERIPEITLIPGVEWTHYRGHANFLGVDQPYDGPFYTNDDTAQQAIFQSARQRGALIVVNHPFEDCCPFEFDLTQTPFDAIEIWNGPMRESNLKAIGMWQQMLAAGRKVPAVGGSDYHWDRLFQILGGPTMGVYAGSDAPADILAALRSGHSFITFSPEGPTLDLTAGDGKLGETIDWEARLDLQISVKGLKTGDVIRLVRADETTDLLQASRDGDADLVAPVPGPGFARVEIYRTFLPGVPPLPALISNPMYFD